MRKMSIVLVNCGDRVLEIVRDALTTTAGCVIETLPDIDAALPRITQHGAGLVLMRLPVGADSRDALRLLGRLSEQDLPVIFVSDAEDLDLRLALLQHGAVDCLCHPLDVARLRFLVDFFTASAVKRAAARAKSEPAEERVPASGYLFVSAAGKRILEQIRAIGPLDTTVLITGETGTGKTHLARAIHELSTRNGKPFMVISCGALPPSLLESELFGHVRGAFTTADRNHVGRLEAVQDGTLLLDEIDCLPFECQSRLLRAMEERVFEPVGSTKTQPVRARFIAAANRPLEAEKAAGRFRSDLYYRLNVAKFALPPLRDRRELIVPLSRKFLTEFESRNGRPTQGLSPEAAAALNAYDWPGNIRELRNAMELAAAYCAGRLIDLSDLPDTLTEAVADRLPLAAEKMLDGGSENKLAQARVSAEVQKLMDALADAGNNRTSAAAALGVSRVTLYKKLRRHGLTKVAKEKGNGHSGSMLDHDVHDHEHDAGLSPN